MAYFFSAPDFYNMRQGSNEKFDRQIDDLVQAGPLMQWARNRQAKNALAKESEREAEEKRRYAEERELRDRYMRLLGGSQGQQQGQPPQQPQGQGTPSPGLPNPYGFDAMGGPLV